MYRDEELYGGGTCLANDDVRESLAGEAVEPANYLADPVEASAWVDPSRLQPTVQALEELSMLATGWDSYDVRPTDPQIALPSLASSLRVTHPDTPPQLEQRLVVIIDSEALGCVEHQWFRPTVQALAELLKLPDGWNSYGASRINPRHVTATLQMLSLIMRKETPAPSVVPTNRGGVQVEWHRSGIDIEIETLSEDCFSAFCADAETGEQWEDEVRDNWSKLCDFARRLSLRTD